jgi:2-polyprenyl-3-methyl-5-hydroxy-6-metoxy-1,4-benzoquinol methylase
MSNHGLKYFTRENCLINNNEKIEDIYSFKKFPIFINCTSDEDNLNDQFYDMNWGISESGHLQLIDLLNPTLIYSNYHTTGVVGKIWDNHHKKIFDFINQDNFNSVLEIGGASGKLVKHFCNLNREFNWSIIEPSIKLSTIDHRVTCISAFFEDYSFNKKFDTIVHSHCLEHVYNPIVFLNKVHSLLNDNGYQYISIPNMKYGLENNFTNTLSFEHTFYIDEFVLEYLLNKTGFIVVDKIVENHSIFVKAKKQNKLNILQKDFLYIKELFYKYMSNLNNDVVTINSKIKDQNFYLFGAHMFSLLLLNLGLYNKNIECILDNDTQKQNKRLYGTPYFVKSIDCLKNKESPIVVLRAGIYTDEIKESIAKVNSTTIFI